MELIKLLQIEGVSETTQEDIIFNFLECIDEESALAIVEEYEQAEMSLTESIINEVSLGYALKKSLGGAVQRFKDIRKKQANVSTDRPIGLAGIRKQEAQKQDVAKSQERFKQAKSTAKDIINRMLNTRYTRDTKGATKTPQGNNNVPQGNNNVPQGNNNVPQGTPKRRGRKSKNQVGTNTETNNPTQEKETNVSQGNNNVPQGTPKRRGRKSKNQTGTNIETNNSTQGKDNTPQGKETNVSQGDNNVPQGKETNANTKTNNPTQGDNSQVGRAAADTIETEKAKQNIIKRYNALKNKKNLTSGDLKLKQTMEDKYDFLS